MVKSDQMAGPQKRESVVVADTSNDRSFGVSDNNDDRNREPTQNRTKGKRTRCRNGGCEKFPQPGCRKMCTRCFQDFLAETAPKGNRTCNLQDEANKNEKEESQRREQYHKQSEIFRQRRRDKDRERYHSLENEDAKNRNTRRAKLDRERYKKFTPEQKAAKNRRQRKYAAKLTQDQLEAKNSRRRQKRAAKKPAAKAAPTAASESVDEKRKRSVPLYDGSEIRRRLARVEDVVLEALSPFAIESPCAIESSAQVYLANMKRIAITKRIANPNITDEAKRQQQQQLQKLASRPMAASASSSLASSSTFPPCPFADIFTKKRKREAATTGIATVPSSYHVIGSNKTQKKKAAQKKRAAKAAAREVALVEQRKQKNRKFFVNRYAVEFEPKEEENNTIVEVIPESHPDAIAKACATNTTTSLNIAPAEHDYNFRQVGGTLPVTEEVHQAFTTGHAIGTVTTLENYYNGINPKNYHTRGKVSSHLPPDLAGGIHKWGLVPLQSILKSSEQEHVWMGALHATDWMAGHVIKNHPELLQGNNKLVMIVIPSGDQRLDLFHQFGAPGRYKDYVNPVKSPFIVPVFAKDTIEFPANWIPHFLVNAPHHPTVVPLVTEEQKRERARVYQQSYNRLYRSIEANRERDRAYQRSYNEANRERLRVNQRKRKSSVCFIVECEKHPATRCMGMCYSHCTDWCTEFNQFFF